MGSCLSSSSGAETTTTGDVIYSSTAKVITVDGRLLEYAEIVKVYEVLGRKHHPSCFLCSSDDLDHDAPIPPLGSQDSLEPGQLYFMLPVQSLQGPLTGRDMAALAVRASLALARAAEKRSGCQLGVVRVLPVGETGWGGVPGDDRDEFEGTSARHHRGEKKKKMILKAKTKEMGRDELIGRAHYDARLGTIHEIAG